MGRLWDLVEEYRDGQMYPPSVRAMATKAGMHNSTLSNWQDLRELPKRKHMEAVARLIGRPYEVVLDAALLDAGYVGSKPVERPTSRRKEA